MGPSFSFDKKNPQSSPFTSLYLVNLYSMSSPSSSPSNPEALSKLLAITPNTLNKHGFWAKDWLDYFSQFVVPEYDKTVVAHNKNKNEIFIDPTEQRDAFKEVFKGLN